MTDNGQTAPSSSLAREHTRQRYFAYVDSSGVYSSARNLHSYGKYLFDDVALAGRSVLDVGGGNGLFSFLAVAMGADRAVCVEPQAAGSTAGTLGAFDAMKTAVGPDADVSFQATSLDQLDAEGSRFEVLLLNNTINHIDEDACMAAHVDPDARSRIEAILNKIFQLGSVGSALIVTDCSRRNLFGDLGIRNPFLRTIEWEKHQRPEFWADLFADVGFVDPRVSWHTPNALGAAGRVALGNRVCAYCTMSHFRLLMGKPG